MEYNLRMSRCMFECIYLKSWDKWKKFAFRCKSLNRQGTKGDGEIPHSKMSWLYEMKAFRNTKLQLLSLNNLFEMQNVNIICDSGLTCRRNQRNYFLPQQYILHCKKWQTVHSLVHLIHQFSAICCFCIQRWLRRFQNHYILQ